MAGNAAIWIVLAIALVIAIIALILAIVFNNQNKANCTCNNMTYNVVQGLAGDTVVTGSNGLFYVINPGFTGTTIAVQKPSGTLTGQQFIISNASGNTVTVVPATNSGATIIGSGVIGASQASQFVWTNSSGSLAQIYYV